MHSVYYGVVKTLFHYWFELNGEQSLKSKINEIDERLLSITPPKSLKSAPRSITCFKNWRAHEFQNFILYYSLFVFYEIMDDKYYNHLKLLVISLVTLSMRIIKKDNLVHVENLLFKFVSNLKILYSEQILTSSFHELLHMSDLTKHFGPLNVTCLFQYEEVNRKISSFIKGKDLIGEEFIKIFTVAQYLTKMSDYIYKEDDNIRSYFEKHLIIKTSNRIETNFSIKYTDKFIKIQDQSIRKAIYEFNNTHVKTIFITKKVKFKNIKINTKSRSKRFFNSCVMDKLTSSIGLIQNIVYDCHNDKNLFFCRKISIREITVDDEFYEYDDDDDDDYSHNLLSSKSFIGTLLNEYFICEIENSITIFYSKFNNRNLFISTFNSEHLFR